MIGVRLTGEKSTKRLRIYVKESFSQENAGFFWKLRNLQKLMQRSYANLLLSVRKIQKTNKGKATAGIDKEIVNTPEQRVKLVNDWKGGNQDPTKRVMIPKANGKKRPRLYPNRARQNRTGNNN